MANIVRDIEADLFRDAEFSEETLMREVEEDNLNAADAGVLLGAEGGYSESS